jgi:hypothetical protein
MKTDDRTFFATGTKLGQSRRLGRRAQAKVRELLKEFGGAARI